MNTFDRMKGTLILISLFLVVSFAHPVIEDTTDDSLETSVEIQEVSFKNLLKQKCISQHLVH